MEARGFGGPSPRSWARRSPFGWPESALILVAGLVGAIAAVTAILTGHWTFIVR
jgi:energy-coupling factor transport system permease protein